jgi:hypothetical protein
VNNKTYMSVPQGTIHFTPLYSLDNNDLHHQRNTKHHGARVVDGQL